MPIAKKREASQLHQQRILELQRKIRDENYIRNAVDRIAVIVSRHIVDSKGNHLNAGDLQIH